MSCDRFEQSAQGVSQHLVMDSSGEAKQDSKITQRTPERERKEKKTAREYLAAQL
jgi:hypothetical protein